MKEHNCKCNHCGKRFYVIPARLNTTKFCSKKCKSESEKNKVERVCCQCNKSFSVVPSQIKIGKGKYCSNVCRYESMKSLKGQKSRGWQGGKTLLNGYVYIYTDIPHPRKINGIYVKRSILVAEKKIGRYLKKDEIVHHVNEIITDDRPENLQVLTLSEHVKLHRRQRYWNSGLPRDKKTGRFLQKNV